MRKDPGFVWKPNCLGHVRTCKECGTCRVTVNRVKDRMRPRLPNPSIARAYQRQRRRNNAHKRKRRFQSLTWAICLKKNLATVSYTERKLVQEPSASANADLAACYAVPAQCVGQALAVQPDTMCCFIRALVGFSNSSGTFILHC